MFEDAIKKLDDISIKIDHFAKQVAKEAGKELENDFESARNQILDELYGVKRKTHSSRKYDVKSAVFINPAKGKDKKWHASLKINGNKMEQHGTKNHPFSGDSVLDLLWMQGIRGLPEKGEKVLDKSYEYLGHSFKAGRVWENPYWDNDVYHNEFKLKLQIGSFVSDYDTPAKIMHQFVYDWGDKRGVDVFDDAISKVKNNL